MRMFGRKYTSKQFNLKCPVCGWDVQYRVESSMEGHELYDEHMKEHERGVRKNRNRSYLEWGKPR